MMFSSCTMGPNYQPDRMKLPAGFKETLKNHPATPEEIAITDKEMIDWWSLFKDPMLTRLVKDAIKGNYNLRIAGQHILAERAMRDR
ncbi:MAG: secretion protein, partial [Acetobacter sp.]|nr:secretion protein [Acetobacter sp.]